MSKKLKELINDYKKSYNLYDAFTVQIYHLIENIIKESGIKIHTIDGRTKDIDSLKKKTLKKEKQYRDFFDVTDLSGIRIVCFSLDQVDQVAKIIKKNFIILNKYSVDKRKIMDPDRFGYLSLHYVVKISKTRANLTEYTKYRDLKCEIQIRTLLQHTWAEIEHDLGYKSEIAVPNNIKRKFYRLAGLLEIADDEFNTVIKIIDSYSKKVTKRIDSSPKKVSIDKISLESYILNSQLIKTIDKEIANRTGTRYHTHFYTVEIENYLKITNFFDIATIDQLDKHLEEKSELIVEFADQWYSRHVQDDDYGRGGVTMGISIFYLGFILAGSTQDYDRIKNYCKIINLFEDKSSAKTIIEIYNMSLADTKS